MLKRKSQLIIDIDENVDKIWDIITNNEDYTWRKDLSKIEIVEDERKFIEYTTSGIATNFTITKKIKNLEYSLAMENDNFIGNSTIVFSSPKGYTTKIIFTENLSIKNPVMWLLSFIAFNPKSLQKKYIKYLRDKIYENKETN